MRHIKWFYHPIFVFVCSILALATSLFLYIYWYVKASARLDWIVRNFNIAPDQVLKSETWVVILVLSILVGIILAGIFSIFFYGQKTVQLYRLQHNFINNFTHELKTPVTSLKLYLETFLKYDLPRDQQLKYINYMLHDAERLSDHINRILSLARIESKSFGGEFVELDLVQVTRQFCENSRHMFPNCDIRIHNPDERSYFYPINLSFFEMLLINVLTNAIKYNRSETPRVDITFVRKGQSLHMEIADNGMGIAKSDIKKIFKKFYQVGRSDDMTAKGSGLGLYLVQSIVKIHNGKMTARSDGPESGTTFVLKLPFKG